MKFLTVLCVFFMISGFIYPQQHRKAPELIAYSIKITEPNAATIAKEGKILKIRWETNSKKTMKVFLFNHNGKEVITQIKAREMLELGKNKYGINWLVPYGTSMWPAGFYRVKVQSNDFKLGKMGQKFKIIAKTEPIERTLDPIHINNCSKRKIKESGTFVYSGGLATSFPNIAGMARVGFENFYWETGPLGMHWHYHGYAHRSYITFDISEIEGKKGWLEKATLILDVKKNHETAPTNDVSCAHHLYHIPSYIGCFNSVGTEITTLPITVGATPPSAVTWDGYHWIEINVTSVVRNWIQNPPPNKIFLLVTYNENFDEGNEHCITYYNVKLYFKFLGPVQTTRSR